MRAILWKELRENLRWAALSLVVFGGALLYALYHSPYGYPDFYYNEGVTICKKTFLLVTTFGAPAIGLFLGLMQILPELRRDRWAALLHRPVPRGRIYAGKALAGALLYLLATGIPFAVAVWLAATPGHFPAPFVPGMMTPGLADIVTGLVYYFAALTLALQRGGWIVLRIFPLLAAVHVSFFVQSTALFYVAIEAAVVMSLALLVAAWGAILNPDTLGPRPWLAKVAFLAVTFYGACGLGDLANALLAAVGPSPRTEDFQYDITKEGMPLRLHSINDVVIDVTDVNGQPLTDPKFQPDRVRTQIQYLNLASYYIGDSHGWKAGKYGRPYRDSPSYLWANSPYQYPRMEQWFYLVRDRSMISYRPDTKEAVDRLGAQGFQPLSATPVPFPPGMDMDTITNDRASLTDPSGVRFVFLPQRTLSEITLPAPAPVFGLATAWASSAQGNLRVVGIALAGGLAVYDDKGALLTLLPYHQDMDRWGRISLGVSPDAKTFFVQYEPSSWIKRDVAKTMPSYLEVMDTSGKVLASYTLPPLPVFPRPDSWSTFFKRRLQSPAFFLGNMLYRKIGAALGSARLKGALDWQMGPGWPATRETLVGGGIMSLVLAIIAFFWARRSGFGPRRAWAWAGFVLALNLPGFIAFRLAADWPRLVACAGCGGRRRVERDDCESCGAGWPAPAANGLEIFDRPTTPAA